MSEVSIVHLKKPDTFSKFRIFCIFCIFLIHLCKTGALEDAEQDRHNAVAEETANVGVHSHLNTEGDPIYEKRQQKVIPIFTPNKNSKTILTLLKNRFSLVAFSPISAVALSLKKWTILNKR